jgi:hypothetical protein
MVVNCTSTLMKLINGILVTIARRSSVSMCSGV